MSHAWLRPSLPYPAQSLNITPTCPNKFLYTRVSVFRSAATYENLDGNKLEFGRILVPLSREPVTRRTNETNYLGSLVKGQQPRGERSELSLCSENGILHLCIGT